MNVTNVVLDYMAQVDDSSHLTVKEIAGRRAAEVDHGLSSIVTAKREREAASRPRMTEEGGGPVEGSVEASVEEASVGSQAAPPPVDRVKKPHFGPQQAKKERRARTPSRVAGPHLSATARPANGSWSRGAFRHVVAGLAVLFTCACAAGIGATLWANPGPTSQCLDAWGASCERVEACKFGAPLQARLEAAAAAAARPRGRLRGGGCGPAPALQLNLTDGLGFNTWPPTSSAVRWLRETARRGAVKVGAIMAVSSLAVYSGTTNRDRASASQRPRQPALGVGAVARRMSLLGVWAGVVAPLEQRHGNPPVVPRAPSTGPRASWPSEEAAHTLGAGTGDMLGAGTGDTPVAAATEHTSAREGCMAALAVLETAEATAKDYATALAVCKVTLEGLSRAAQLAEMPPPSNALVEHIDHRRRLSTTVSNYTSSFESDLDSWTLDGASFERLSGSTPTANTGPSSAYAGSYYVYAETSTPNNPGIEFSMERDFGDSGLDVVSVSFYYHMWSVYSGMGTVLLQGSGDGDSYTTLWSKAGNQATDWRSATVSLGSAGTQRLRFVYTSGGNFYGDFALDEVEVAVGAWPSPQPTASPAPTATPSPTVSHHPSPEPSLVPTTSMPTATAYAVSSFSALSDAIQTNAQINVLGNITFTAPITISAKSNIKIYSESRAALTSDRSYSPGYGGLFAIRRGSDVTFTGVDFVSGSSSLGGCLFVTESSNVEAESSNFKDCTAGTYYGGAICANDYSTVTVHSGSTFSGNSAAQGGGGVYLSDAVASFIDVGMSNNTVTDDDAGADIHNNAGSFTCATSCTAGQYGDCSETADTSDAWYDCYINCGSCLKCPAGTRGCSSGGGWRPSTTADADRNQSSSITRATALSRSPPTPFPPPQVRQTPTLAP